MLTDKETTIAYHCPQCGLAIISSVNIFAINGDLLKLKCECGRSELQIKITRDKKVHLTVPCLACPTPHNYTLSSTSFFNKDIFCLACTMSGIDICFFGTNKNVLSALRQNEKELMEMMQQEEDSLPDALDDIHTFDNFDSEITSNINPAAFDDEYAEKIAIAMEAMDIDINCAQRILTHVGKLMKKQKLVCHCGSKSIEMTVNANGINLTCAECNATKVIPSYSNEDAEAFEKVDGLVL